jgi:hypothetical protein
MIVDDIRNLEVGEFDAWVSGANGISRPITVAGSPDALNSKHALKLLRARQEAELLSALVELCMTGAADSESPADWSAPD